MSAVESIVEAIRSFVLCYLAMRARRRTPLPPEKIGLLRTLVHQFGWPWTSDDLAIANRLDDDTFPEEIGAAARRLLADDAHKAMRLRAALEPLLLDGGLASIADLSPDAAASLAAALRADPGTRPQGSAATLQRGPHRRGNERRAAAPKPSVSCFAMAEMPSAPPAGQAVPLTVTLSLEALLPATDQETGSATFKAPPDAELSVTVQAKANCEIVGETTRVVPMPQPSQPHALSFQTVGSRAGPAELWVLIAEGTRKLCILVLQPEFATKAAEGARNRRSALRANAAVDPAATVPPSVEMTITEESIGNGRFRLRFLLSCEELNLFQDVSTQDLRDGLDAHVAALYRRVEQTWAARQDDFAGFMSDLADIGAEYYSILVPTPIQESIWTHRDSIGSIRVHADDSLIPWELLHIRSPDPGVPLPQMGARFLAELGMVRWIYNKGFPPSSLRVRRGRAYYVIPRYQLERYALPFAEEEIGFVQRLWQAVPVTPLEKDRVIAVLGGDVDLVHFACHGSAPLDSVLDAALLLDVRPGAEGSEVERMLEMSAVSQRVQMRRPGPLVFLNACQSGRSGRTLTGAGGLARTFVQRGAGIFVGTLWSVNDRAARHFAESFYSAFKKGSTLVDAAAAGRRAAKDAGDPTWLAYTVYGHPYARVAPAGV